MFHGGGGAEAEEAWALDYHNTPDEPNMTPPNPQTLYAIDFAHPWLCYVALDIQVCKQLITWPPERVDSSSNLESPQVYSTCRYVLYIYVYIAL
jgi:hypothetical protein